MAHTTCQKCFVCLNYSQCEEKDCFLLCEFSFVYCDFDSFPDECCLACDHYVPVGSVPIHDSDSEIPF